MKIKIFRDCQGNVDTNAYFKESEIPKLKSFLEDLGYQVEDVENHGESFRKGKPFRYEKPSVAKKIVHEVDWHNPKIITLLLNNSDKSDEVILKMLVKESGLVEISQSSATTFTIIARFRSIAKEYEKWKQENKITESPDNRNKLHSEFSNYYIDLIKKQKQKRLQPGTKVYIESLNENGIIKNYKEDTRKYDVEYSNGFSGYFERKNLKVLDKLDKKVVNGQESKANN